MDLLRRTTNIMNRTRRVALVMARYGFGHIIQRLGFGRLLRGRDVSQQLKEGTPAADAVRMRMVIEELGPTYVKLGQMLSTRADLIPREFVVELRKLQDEVPPFPFEKAKQIIETELGGPLEEFFAEFEEKPHASASIGQVHHGRLHTGEEVAVKVQRPGIQETIETDLTVLRHLANVLEGRLEWARRVNLSQIVDEFASTIRGELVYTNEGHNADRLRANEGDHGIRIPMVYWNLTTNRVLTMELLHGRKVTELEEYAISMEERSQAADRITESFLRQIFIDGFFHADPHGGNVLVGEHAELALLDFGSVGWIGRESREGLLRMVTGIFREDAEAVCDEVLSMGVLEEDSRVEQLRREGDRLLGKFHAVDRAELRISDILETLMHLMFKYEIRMPSEFALLMRTIIMTEGLCLQLCPNYDYRRSADLFVRRITIRQIIPPRLFEDALQTVQDARRHLAALPRQMTLLLDRLHSGRMKVRVEYDSIDRPLQGLNAIGNRLSFSMVVSAILIASALIIQGGGPQPKLWGLPALGVLGFIISAVMGFWLLVSIIRHGRM